MFGLDHLEAAEFEEFVYELLAALGYKNLSWRKGTGVQGASPADQGRDIEAIEEVIERDGRVRHDRWFIECKHHRRGVPPEKLEGALSWAQAHAPSYLLFVCSNFLSNSSKAFLDKYIETRKPPFKIRIWEQKDLERLVAGYPKLQRRYRLDGEISSLAAAHPLHLAYALSPRLNTVEFFLECLDQLDPTKRDQALNVVFDETISPRMRSPRHPDESLKDLRLDVVDYPSFVKQICRRMAAGNEISIVHNIVTWTLSWLLHCGDSGRVEETRARLRDAQKSFSDRANEEEEPERQLVLHEMVQSLEKYIESAESRASEAYALYTYINERLVARLLTEDVKVGPEGVGA